MSDQPRGGQPAGDGALLAQLRAGDADAFRALVTRHHASMLRIARTIAREGAEDVVQETWAAVIDGLERFEERSSLRTWMFRILTNRANTWATRARRDELASSLRDEAAAADPAIEPERFGRFGNWSSPPAAWAERSAEELLERLQAGAALQRLLEKLPDGQRLVVTLRDMEGLASSEVCEVLGISEANQRVLLHRGRSKLRSSMERYLSSE